MLVCRYNTQMDLDRILGIVFGLMILVAVFLLPFGHFILPSGQVSDKTFFLTVRQLVEAIMVDTQQPMNFLLYETMLIVSFAALIVAGILGFYPMRSGAIGILGMVIVTAVSMFPPQLGFTIPRYDVGYFASWGFSVASIIVGRLQPFTSGKLSFLSQKKIPEKVETTVEQPVEKVTPPAELFQPLSGSEEHAPSEPPSLEASISPPADLFSSLSIPEAEEEYQRRPVVHFPSPPVEVNVIEEEITRIRIFLALIKEEKNSGSLSEEAYDRLKERFEKILDELNEEKERVVKGS
ncbi:MAG: hypothetical protein FGF52_03120 [Candidatus Brockarchaeota archaeon]|nr:hypothetical protein [Candidatus Brockarchaeota archaeon]